MAGIFGTDGVRSRINTGPMRAEFIVRLALAAGEYFIAKNEPCPPGDFSFCIFLLLFLFLPGCVHARALHREASSWVHPARV